MLSEIAKTYHSEHKPPILLENYTVYYRIENLTRKAFNNLLSLVNHTKSLENLKAGGNIMYDHRTRQDTIDT